MSTNEAVFRVLRNRRYNREAPHLPSSLQKRIEVFVSSNKPIELVGFWGVGSKVHVSEADRQTCAFLHELDQEVKAVYSPGIRFYFVFATLHGLHNGYDATSIRSYIREVKQLFTKYGFSSQLLEPLWEKYDISWEKIEKLLLAQPEGWWEKTPQYEVIERNAKRRQRRLSAKEGAMRYYIMRDLEKKMWEKEFPDAIFHAFSDSRLRCVLPNMPSLYFYARRGWSDTPWFDESQAPSETISY